MGRFWGHARDVFGRMSKKVSGKVSQSCVDVVENIRIVTTYVTNVIKSIKSYMGMYFFSQPRVPLN